MVIVTVALPRLSDTTTLDNHYTYHSLIIPLYRLQTKSGGIGQQTTEINALVYGRVGCFDRFMCNFASQSHCG